MSLEGGMSAFYLQDRHEPFINKVNKFPVFYNIDLGARFVSLSCLLCSSET